MFSRMGGQRLAVQSSGAVSLETMLREGVRRQPDVSALASLDSHKLALLVWHYHDDDLPGPEAKIELNVKNLPADFRPSSVRHFRVDQTYSNAYTLWKEMGRPQDPAPEQYARLEQAGRLAEIPAPELSVSETGGCIFRFSLPRQGVSLLELHRTG